MRAFQKRGRLSSIVGAAFFTECILTSVRGDGADSEEKLDLKFVLIGVGIGLVLAALFIMVKICIIRKHVHDNSKEYRVQRPSEPHLFTLNHLSQSENPGASDDVRC